MFTKRREPIMLITYWYLCFPVSWALWFAIRGHRWASHHSASSPFTFFMIPSLALSLCFLFWSCLLLRRSSLESAMPHVPVLATIGDGRGRGTNFIVFLY